MCSLLLQGNGREQRNANQWRVSELVLGCSDEEDNDGDNIFSSILVTIEKEVDDYDDDYNDGYYFTKVRHFTVTYIGTKYFE